jgi:hypothetical protein
MLINPAVPRVCAATADLGVWVRALLGVAFVALFALWAEAQTDGSATDEIVVAGDEAPEDAEDRSETDEDPRDEDVHVASRVWFFGESSSVLPVTVVDDHEFSSSSKVRRPPRA